MQFPDCDCHIDSGLEGIIPPLIGVPFERIMKDMNDVSWAVHAIR